MEMGWNGTRHRPVPPKCKGIKPITKETWAADAHAFHEINVANQDAFHKKYDDRSVLSKSKGYRSEVTHSGIKKGERLPWWHAPQCRGGADGFDFPVLRSTGADAPDWDSSPHRPIPPAWRGLSAPRARACPPRGAVAAEGRGFAVSPDQLYELRR